ncbi:hypothetical protein CCASP_04605 [Corynebacterium caspium DSM 44850]|nr:hypothetical protein CCASP_04605 [Corynebacterium caspium DSM 44850]
MLAARFLPLLWLRLVVILAFSLWLASQGKWLFLAICIGLAAISVWQLVGAYRHRDLDLSHE